MDDLSGAVSLARAFISLSRSRKSGVLEVRARGARCRISIVVGVPRAATPVAGAEETLGDVLMRRGQFNLKAHQDAMLRFEPARPIGLWLVEVGAATRAAVRQALLDQLRSRLMHLFTLQEIEYEFQEGGADIGVPMLGSAVSVADLALAALGRAVAEYPMSRIRGLIGGEPLRLTGLGTYLLGRAALAPEDAPWAHLLESGGDVDAIEKSCFGSHRALRTLAVFALLSAVTSESQLGSSSSLLLRKQRQVRGSAGAGALLDLPQGAGPEQARRALRRLAGQLHPDRLGPAAPRALRQASCEVMQALVRAEKEVSGAEPEFPFRR